ILIFVESTEDVTWAFETKDKRQKKIDRRPVAQDLIQKSIIFTNFKLLTFNLKLSSSFKITQQFLHITFVYPTIYSSCTSFGKAIFIIIYFFLVILTIVQPYFF